MRLRGGAGWGRRCAQGSTPPLPLAPPPAAWRAPMHFPEEAQQAAAPALASGSRREAASGGLRPPVPRGHRSASLPRCARPPTPGCGDTGRRSSFPRRRVRSSPSRLLLRRAGGHRPGARRVGHCRRAAGGAAAAEPALLCGGAAGSAPAGGTEGGREGAIDRRRVRRCAAAPAPPSRCLCPLASPASASHLRRRPPARPPAVSRRSRRPQPAPPSRSSQGKGRKGKGKREPSRAGPQRSPPRSALPLQCPAHAAARRCTAPAGGGTCSLCLHPPPGEL